MITLVRHSQRTHSAGFIQVFFKVIAEDVDFALLLERAKEHLDPLAYAMLRDQHLIIRSYSHAPEQLPNAFQAPVTSFFPSDARSFGL